MATARFHSLRHTSRGPALLFAKRMNARLLRGSKSFARGAPVMTKKKTQMLGRVAISQGGEPPASEENPANDPNSRVSPGLPEPLPSFDTPKSDSRAVEYSSTAAQNDVEEQPYRQEPSANQVREPPIDGGNPSVSYLRSLFEGNVYPATPDETNRSTSDLFSIEVATGEEVTDPPNATPRFDPYGNPPIGTYAFFPLRDSPNNVSGGSPRDAEIHERSSPSRNGPHQLSESDLEDVALPSVH